MSFPELQARRQLAKNRDEEKNSKYPTWKIVAIVCGGTLLVIAIIVCIVLYIYRKKIWPKKSGNGKLEAFDHSALDTQTSKSETDDAKSGKSEPLQDIKSDPQPSKSETNDAKSGKSEPPEAQKPQKSGNGKSSGPKIGSYAGSTKSSRLRSGDTTVDDIDYGNMTRRQLRMLKNK